MNKIKKFKSHYDSLPREIFCLSLNKKIKITRAGFSHVFQGKARKGEDINTRGLCIKKLPILIEKINFYQDHAKKIEINGNIEFWNLQGVIDKTCIHITIRKIGNQEYHLFSWHYKGKTPKIINS